MPGFELTHFKYEGKIRDVYRADSGPAERFERLRRELADAIEIDSSPGNPAGIRRKAHSVLTVDLVDEPGHPTRDALDRVLAFLRRQLRA